LQPNTPPAKLVADAAPVLERWASGWYLFGAQAVVIWGHPRQTADVDITIRLRPEDAVPFWRDMEKAGFELRVGEPEDFLARTRVIPFLHVETGMPLDIVLAGPGLENIFFERVVLVRFGGTEIPVAAPEDVIIMKVLAGRLKDSADVFSILLQRLPTLDLTHIRNTLAMLEEALGQSDLLRPFEAEVQRARSRR
jgi:hypothetical protein